MCTVVITGVTGKSGQFLLKRMIEEADSAKDYRFILLYRKETQNSKNTIAYELLGK